MSLFENDEYRWRETYFVLFDEGHRPTARDVERTLSEIGPHYQVTELRQDDSGLFESLTLLSPDDYAAMDITYLAGDEVLEQGVELAKELKPMVETPEERARLLQLPKCNARLEIYHFEQVVIADGDEEEFLDPGSLLIVLERLARLCRGIGIDPQSGSLM